MEDILVPIGVVGMLFIGLPWLVLHYMTQWRRARGLSMEDEQLLDNLHETARRLDERLQSIERIMTAENPRWRESAIEQRPSAEITELSNVRSSH
jgi:phage shock protein B